MSLPKRQKDCLEAIVRLTAKLGVAPTIRELGVELGGIGTNAVNDHLRALRKRGMVTWKPRQSRTLRALVSTAVLEECELIDYGELSDEALKRGDEVLTVFEDCFVGARVEDRTNARRYLAAMLQDFGAGR